MFMIDINNLQHHQLRINHWQVDKHATWCVLGKNGSGKQYIDELFTGKLIPQHVDTLTLPPADKIGMVSFETQQRIYEHELKLDASDFLDANDVGTLAKDFLPKEKLDDPLIKAFNLGHRMETGYRQLSTGEGRKLLILQAIFNGVELLICDNPFDSLDVESCHALSNALAELAKNNITIILLLSNRQDIPAWCKNIAFIERGQLDVIGEFDNEETKRQLDVLLTPKENNLTWPATLKHRESYDHPYLVELNNGKVSYNGVNVFSELNVRIKPLQHTLISGRNGSGKSTLMHLITGDCTQCYSNDLRVLGIKRGSGESIWELKKQMGIVSAELHRQYRVNGDLLTVVISGFYDTIGLYRQPEKHHIELARQWLQQVGLLDYQNTPFQQLSYGEQRLALIARALVKSPLLLILDEPTQGLDELNRHRILNFLEYLTEQQQSTILLVSHRTDEHLPLFKQHIKL